MFKNILTWIGIFLLGFVICFFFFRKTNVVTNAVPVPLIEKEVAPDLFEELEDNQEIGFFERPFKDKHDPIIVERQVFDTIRDIQYIKEIEKLKVMLSVKKQGKTLNIYAYDQFGNVLDHIVYEGVDRDFVITATEDVPNVQSDKWYWNGLNLDFGVKRNVNEISHTQFGNLQKTLELNSGVNYRENIFLRIGAQYEFERKDVSLKAELGLRLF